MLNHVTLHLISPPPRIAPMHGLALFLTLLAVLVVDDVTSIYIPGANDTSRIKHNSVAKIDVRNDVRNDVMTHSDVRNEVSDDRTNHVDTDNGQHVKRYSSAFKNDRVIVVFNFRNYI